MGNGSTSKSVSSCCSFVGADQRSTRRSTNFVAARAGDVPYMALTPLSPPQSGAPRELRPRTPPCSYATAVTLTQQTPNPRNNNAKAFRVPRHILYLKFTGHLPLDRTSMERGVPSQSKPQSKPTVHLSPNHKNYRVTENHRATRTCDEFPEQDDLPDLSPFLP